MSQAKISATDRAYLEGRFAEMTPTQRASFTVWLLAQAESNSLEGEHDTAALLRGMYEIGMRR